MRFHDAYLRSTPIDLLFTSAAEAREWMARIGTSPEAPGQSLLDFATNPAVGELAGRVRSPDDQAPEGPYAALAFFTAHTLRTGDVRLAGAESLRSCAVASAAGSDRTVAWPSGAGYVQLARHLVWMQPGPDSGAQSVDGFFWLFPGGEHLSLLFVSGLIHDIPQLSVSLVQDAPVAHAGRWDAEPMREAGSDFASDLPGGDDLLWLANTGEALKLVTRLMLRRTVEAPSVDDADGPLRSWLEYRAIPASGAVPR